MANSKIKPDQNKTLIDIEKDKKHCEWLSAKCHLPSPIALAVLTALVDLKMGTKANFGAAIKLYCQAALLRKRLEQMTWEELIHEFEDDENLLMEAILIPKLRSKESLIFDPSCFPQCEGGKYLVQQNHPFKIWRHFLKSFEASFIGIQLKNSLSQENAKFQFDNLIRESDIGNGKYQIPRKIIDGMVNWKKYKKREGGKKSHRTRKKTSLENTGREKNVGKNIRKMRTTSHLKV